MRALVWHGKKDIRCDTVPDPGIEEPRDAIVRVSTCAICGSDLHLMDGFVPGMCKGDVLGHETMGEVVEVGRECRDLKVGDRVIIPFQMTCGECEQCRAGNFSVCETTNRNKDLGDAFFGHATAGIFGYSALTGSYAGGQAEYIRVGWADTTCVKVPTTMSDEQLLFLTDILPTGWQAAAYCDIQPTDTVAVWGCGPVGLFAIQSAIVMGARRVVAIDDVPERLAMAAGVAAGEVRVAEDARRGVTEEGVAEVLVAIGGLADREIARHALLALAAGHLERDDHTVPDLQLPAVAADLHHLAHGLVAEHVTGFHFRHEAAHEVQVRAADRTAGDLDDDVA